ncbi:hypothetical protein [Roseisolibacter agri]|uniref:Lipoprotein n=1 Tax=Roseisolibacter agri TaxID=2014610 RepID=A0AA37Q8H7_9BACT|nr:hypothetical protein [Roseisolibacter agri]GLC28534.1 hypothetical protein rosag_50470 [Roseisolibacter agri]
MQRSLLVYAIGLVMIAACNDAGRTLTSPSASPSLARDGSGGNPHFIYADASLSNDGVGHVAWKEAGLSSGSAIDYRASADGQATYACINGGAKNPNAANKRTINAQVTAEGTFVVKNGNVVASLDFGVPGPGDFECPSGQRRVLADVAYSNIQLDDLTTPLSADVDPTSLGPLVLIDLSGL